MPEAYILIVEDDENLRMALEDNLVEEGYRVTAVGRGDLAIAALAQEPADLVILDLMLPDTDGYRVCRTIRERGFPVRVLMLTARTLENDLVDGFDAGADDYLAKPYRLRELLARVSALLRRQIAPTAAAADTLEFAGFTMNLVARALHDPAGSEVRLTRTEFDLLLFLLRNVGRALSRDDLLKHAWDPSVVVEPRTVDNFVSNLKKKLNWQETDAYRIKTVRGVGYRMEID